MTEGDEESIDLQGSDDDFGDGVDKLRALKAHQKAGLRNLNSIVIPREGIATSHQYQHQYSTTNHNTSTSPVYQISHKTFMPPAPNDDTTALLITCLEDLVDLDHIASHIGIYCHARFQKFHCGFGPSEPETATPGESQTKIDAWHHITKGSR
ncbi:hypothetical protein K440DRAFT_636719 [Wilcoxina mikolae CBS 423.85]|nr:hypothetical protein K440DRAFT_636719 [Wilcoxina mikolae CBS 423.85]